ncbi:MAG: Gldg family protein [Halioglobus sp.]|nr:Gldg family protein [Halioglobus sp.]
MSTSSIIIRVAEKELDLLFRSSVAWLFLASFAATNLFAFFWIESFFARNIADIRPLFEWMPLLLVFFCSAITMRTWSEERNSGTLEHVLIQPHSVWLFVIGKFCASFILLFLAIVSTLPLPLTVAGIADLDWGPVFGGYLATMLLGAMYLAIGLLMSALTSNAMISLIASIGLSSSFYLCSSNALATLVDEKYAELLNRIGSGAHFENITRGIFDLSDMIYYISVAIAFLALNVFVLEKVRWTTRTTTVQQRRSRLLTALLMANLLLLNLWVDRLKADRLDLTEGQLYSISETTSNLLNTLKEPLLIRAYLSTKTHRLLAPLVPQLQDLLLEYEIAGNGNIAVEFIDPAKAPAKEQEANERFGIHPTSFRVADRHQSSLANAYFNILVQYGDGQQTLNFSDLLEVRRGPRQSLDIRLRNPEYSISSAIKRALLEYNAGGSLFDGIDEPVELIGYVSREDLLPQRQRDYKNAIRPILEAAVGKSGGKFSVRFVEPEANGGVVASKIEQTWNFKPQKKSEQDKEKFFFYLTLADSKQVVRLPTDNLDSGDFRLALDAGLKRFTTAFTKVVALSVPDVDPHLARLGRGGPSFRNLERVLSRDYSLRLESLSNGSVTPDADILVVLAPRALDAKAVFAVDQFLMRGGTVVLSTSPLSATIDDGRLSMKEWDSGLHDWLAHHGVDLRKALVLDRQHSSFSGPVIRRAGEHEFREVQVVDYPYFIDLRSPGLIGNPITINLPQVTMAWASPINVLETDGRRLDLLLKSSALSWESGSRDVMPIIDGEAPRDFQTPVTTNGPHTVGILLEGRFDSYFSTNPEEDANSKKRRTTSLPLAAGFLENSPESSRIILFSSNDFLSDRVLQSIAAANGNGYLGPLELMANTVDWAVEQENLVDIRARGHFNRTIPLMEERTQLLIEYATYAMTVSILALYALCTGFWIRNRRRYLARGISV